MLFVALFFDLALLSLASLRCLLTLFVFDSASTDVSPPPAFATDARSGERADRPDATPSIARAPSSTAPPFRGGVAGASAWAREGKVRLAEMGFGPTYE